MIPAHGCTDLLFLESGTEFLNLESGLLQIFSSLFEGREFLLQVLLLAEGFCEELLSLLPFLIVRLQFAFQDRDFFLRL